MYYLLFSFQFNSNFNFLLNKYHRFCIIEIDPQSGKTSSSTPAASTTNAAAKRGMDKSHVPSPIKRAKTAVGKKHTLHE